MVYVGVSGEAYLCVACLLVSLPLTTHPFRDGAPLPTLNENTSNIWALIIYGGGCEQHILPAC